MPFLFSVTLFGSAFLSFLIQPILGKMLLPMVGGAPSGWIVSMAFFQMALLAGYGVSYLLQKYISLWIHAALLVGFYLLALFYLPPVITFPDTQAASLNVFIALLGAIFVPYVALAATTSALQRIFAATRHKTAADPYYLFVSSNAGSLIGLFCYPLFLELFMGLSDQMALWQILYLVVLTLIIASVALAWIFKAPAAPETQRTGKLPVPDRGILLQWFILAFVPCSLSMGVTTLITADVGGLPLFWVIPLGLYLITFILAFQRAGSVSIGKLNSNHLNSAAFLLCLVALGIGFRPGGDILTFIVMVFLMLEVFFVIALSCHAQLAGLRPSPHYLGLFYFVVAVGGAAAGLLHAFVLPLILNDVIEFPIVVLLSLLLLPDTSKSLRFQKIRGWAFAVALISTAALYFMKQHNTSYIYYVPTAVVFIASYFFVMDRPKHLLCLGAVILLFCVSDRYTGGTLDRSRNFFGTYSVREAKADTVTTRSFIHGNTSHGMAAYGVTDAVKYNSSYYSRSGPAGKLIRASGADEVGAIGLGVGQVACISPGVSMDFYEIDAEVVRLAKTYFPYLEECPVRNIYVGDGRLELQETEHVYDILMLDAFTSDSIPVHIVTREAISAYRKHLSRNGFLLFHVSNRYFNLVPKLARIAEVEGLQAYEILHQPDHKAYPFALVSRWVAIPLSATGQKKLASLGWQKTVPAGELWTDDHSSLLSAIDLKQQLDLFKPGSRAH